MCTQTYIHVVQCSPPGRNVSCSAAAWRTEMTFEQQQEQTDLPLLFTYPWYSFNSCRTFCTISLRQTRHGGWVEGEEERRGEEDWLKAAMREKVLSSPGPCWDSHVAARSCSWDKGFGSLDTTRWDDGHTQPVAVPAQIPSGKHKHTHTARSAHTLTYCWCQTQSVVVWILIHGDYL